jgi:hypothetical protein
MASGSLYRSPDGSAALGASDGIAIFRGQWSGSLDDLTITYWVESAELLPLDVVGKPLGVVGKRRTTGVRRVAGSKALVFSYYRWLVEPGFIDVELTPAQSASFAVSDRFVECRTTSN